MSSEKEGLVFTFHYNRADNIYEFAPAEWAKVRDHIARLEKEHIEDVNRMERAAIVIEDLTAQVNRRAAQETKPEQPWPTIPPFIHWDKDPHVPYHRCNCSTCGAARTAVTVTVSNSTG